MQRRSLKRKSTFGDPGTWKKYKYNPKVASTASLTRKVNKILSEQERKNLDTTTTLLATAAGVAQIFQLNSITQGDDATSRDGRKVSMVSSQMRYSINPSGAAAVGLFRVIVFRDLQSNGVAPVAGDVLTVPGNFQSPLTLDFKERFRVIHDNYSSLGKGDFDFAAGAAATVTTTIPGSYFYKFKDEDSQTEYGGIGNIPTTNGLMMLVITEKSNTLSYYHRLRFTDS